MFAQISNLLKLRIGVIMMLTALAAMVVTPGTRPDVLEALVLAFAGPLPDVPGGEDVPGHGDSVLLVDVPRGCIHAVHWRPPSVR